MLKARLFALTPARLAIRHMTLLLACTVVSRLDARARVAQLRIKQGFECCAVEKRAVVGPDDRLQSEAL